MPLVSRAPRIPRLVFLIGYRASGKSSLGKLLAAQTGYRLVDTDVELVSRLGMTITEYFESHGEGAFRNAESAVLREAIESASEPDSMGAFIATGGGVVLSKDNVDLMRQRGRVVWLNAPPAVLRQRLGADPNSGVMRPSLSGAASATDEIETVLAERLPLYRSAAHVELSTESGAPEELVDELLNQLGS